MDLPCGLSTCLLEVRDNVGVTSAHAPCTRVVMLRSLLPALLVTGCTQWAYLPVPAPPEVTVQQFGRQSAYYAMPAASPHGDLQIVVYGVEKLTAGDPDSPGSSDVDISVLHVRLLGTNSGQQPWTIDTREQSVELPIGTEPPAFATSDREGDASSPPVVKLIFGVPRVIDLFFPLPQGMSAGDLPGFRMHDLVHTDQGDVSETTAFNRESKSIYYGMEDSQEDEDSYVYWDSPIWFYDGYVGFGGIRVGREWHGRVYAHPTVWGRSSTRWTSGGRSGGGRGGGGRRFQSGGGHSSTHSGGGGHGGGGHR